MSKTILVVDDEPDFRASVRDILCLEGYEVIEAENGKKGLPIVEKEDLDLVITDILMPESEGNDFAFNINEI
ncbi:MAG: response regulator, partial [Pseudomonadales bacterium]|nr:response regulator [Pseudomonadales bacterium]